jgi:hypothetical protein
MHSTGQSAMNMPAAACATRRPTRTRASPLRAPAGSWDCHIHLFGPASRFPFAPESPYVSDDALPGDYLAMQDVLGLERAVVVSAGGYGADTRHLRWVLEGHGDRLRGIILAPEPAQPTQAGELAALGVRGVRMFGAPAGNEWDHLPRIDARLAGMADEIGWHVQYHSITRDDIEHAAEPLLALGARWCSTISACSTRGSGSTSRGSRRSCGCSTAAACGSSCRARCAPRARRSSPTLR